MPVSKQFSFHLHQPCGQKTVQNDTKFNAIYFERVILICLIIQVEINLKEIETRLPEEGKTVYYVVSSNIKRLPFRLTQCKRVGTKQ